MNATFETESLLAKLFSLSAVHPEIPALQAAMAKQSERLMEYEKSCTRLGCLYARIAPNLVASEVTRHYYDRNWMSDARARYIENALTFLSEWLHSNQCRREITIGKSELRGCRVALYSKIQKLEARAVSPVVAAMQSCMLASISMDKEVPDNRLTEWRNQADEIRSLQRAAFAELDSALSSQCNQYSNAPAVLDENNLSVSPAELRCLRVVSLLDNVKQDHPLAFKLVGLLKDAEASLVTFEHAGIVRPIASADHDELLCKLLIEDDTGKIREQIEIHEKELLLLTMNQASLVLMDQRRNKLVEQLVLVLEKSLDETHNLSSDPAQSRIIFMDVLQNNFLAADVLIRKLKRVKLCCSDPVDLSPIHEAFSKLRRDFEPMESLNDLI